MTNNNWKRMMFKGHKVYLCVDEQGEPVVRDDKVLIKYQINHDYEYYVSPEAVQPIDPNQLKKKKGKTASKKARVSSPPASPEPARHLPEAKPMADGRERWRAGEREATRIRDGRGSCCRTKTTVSEGRYAGENSYYLQVSCLIGRSFSHQTLCHPRFYNS